MSATRFAKSGFTLIELLVVIAIIGILASVVLASLNSARNKGTDAAIKSTFSQLRTQMESYYDTSTAKNYGTAGWCMVTAAGVPSGGCSVLSDQTILVMLQDIAKKTSEPGSFVRINITTTPTPSYTIYGALKSDPDPSDAYLYPGWCIDSTGAAQSYKLRQNNQAVGCGTVGVL